MYKTCRPDMSLAIPARVISTSGNQAEVDVMGCRTNISIERFPQLREGEYVLLEDGVAVKPIERATAERTIEVIHKLLKEKRMGTSTLF